MGDILRSQGQQEFEIRRWLLHRVPFESLYMQSHVECIFHPCCFLPFGPPPLPLPCHFAFRFLPLVVSLLRLLPVDDDGVAARGVRGEFVLLDRGVEGFRG